MHKKAYGFTIIELLIVIVVIGVLAAISVIGYSAISNRAHNSAVKNDLMSFAKQIQLIYAETGQYPAGGSVQPTPADSNTSVSWTTLSGVNFSASRPSYYTSSNNLLYCTGMLDGQPTFRITARAKSGETFAYDPTNGMQSLGQTDTHAASSVCGSIGYPRSWAGGYWSGGAWSNWVR